MATSLYNITLGQQVEFHRILSKAGLSAEDAAQIIANPDLGKAWVDDLRERLGLKLFHGRYTPPERQLANLRAWAGHYFRPEQFDDAWAALPPFVWGRPLVPLTLCWTKNTLEQTVTAKTEIMRTVYGQDKLYVSGHLNQLANGDVYLPEGAPEFMPNHLWWEVIDLGANRGTAPDQIDPRVAAGTQVFDVAIQHPAYIRQHNGGDTPYLDVPGLRVKVPGESEPYALYVRGGSDGRLSVSVPLTGYAGMSYAEPVVIRGLQS